MIDAQQHGHTIVLTFRNPPVNGFNHAVRSGLLAHLDEAIANRAVQAVVLTGADTLFSGGADVREFGTPKMLAEPSLHTLIEAIEASPKPIVAAIHGTCMGGGLELALACHYRVTSADAVVALPEVKLGLLPGAGGTQRLPRVVDVETALNMIVSGNPRKASSLRGSALFDRICDGPPLQAALALAEEVAARRPLPRVRDRAATLAAHEAFFQFARNTVGGASKHFPAPLQCVEAVAAAVSKPFDEGLALERSLFLSLLHSPQSRALRHAFFAERAAAKVGDLPADTPVRPIARVAVIGAGTMGSGISMNFLSAGIPVTLLETRQEALDRGVASIGRNYDTSVRKGRLTPAERDRAMALLTPTLEHAALADADLLIEAVFEDMAVKESVFRQLDAVAKPGAILASNTSTLDVNRIAQCTRRPADVIGLHFFSPANVMKLLEVVRGAATADDVLATAMHTARRIGKTAVVSGVCDGFIGNRMLEQYVRQAMFLLEEGALPQQVDRALENFGFAMGVFRVGDLAGNDIGWAIRKRRYLEKPQVGYSRIGDRLCEAGRYGQKTGAGWYRYPPGQREALVDAWVTGMIEDYRREHGITPRPISDEEIVDRCVLALVNEGARILEEGIAQRASDIDIVYLSGYGFPLHRGGPMLYADGLGLFKVARAMRAFAALPGADAAFWEPAPLLARLVAEGKSFNG